MKLQTLCTVAKFSLYINYRQLAELETRCQTITVTETPQH